MMRAGGGAALKPPPLPPSDWRVAGMSYLKYSNLCADMVRAALKEPVKLKAKTREAVYFRSAVWKNGAPEKQGGCCCCCSRVGWVGSGGWGVSGRAALASVAAAGTAARHAGAAARLSGGGGAGG